MSIDEPPLTIQDDDWPAKNLWCTTDIYTKKSCCSNKRSLAKQDFSIAKRAKIILTSAENPDWTDAQVAQSIGCSSALVRKWRKRWCQTRSVEEASAIGTSGLYLWDWRDFSKPRGRV